MPKSLTANIITTLAKIGREGDTVHPPSQDPMDIHMHMYFVTTVLERYCKKWRKEAKDNLLDNLPEANMGTIEAAVSDAKENDIGETNLIAKAENYLLDLMTKKPTVRFSVPKLRIRLAKDGWSTSSIEKFVEDCSSKDEPAKTFIVRERI